jgi:DNA-binding MarR family transcriptional regulator
MSKDDHESRQGQLAADLIAQADFFENEGLRRPAAEALAEIDQTMQAIRRNVGRREVLALLLKVIEPRLDLPQLDAIVAVSNGSSWPGLEVTVGYVAEKLQVDPSRASRLVSEVVEMGYLRRVASQSDSRRICLELTAKSDAFLADFHRRKWQLMAQGMKSWSDEDTVTFARLLDRFAHWMGETQIQQAKELGVTEAK